ncbi:MULTISPECIES: sensor domain-containing diguanylate cyclase [Bacillaceae]|uniref:Sensor domain-containing diguanylate cyclase n=1 Tax=Evansella alkalicola TaxID=745819 RepID=A0ABS6JUY8_9BACI|nr:MULTISPECIES: sensor domain-containing diguanylate cyclase [Bacillaceae]MBU9721921.1 sensor domain-containing diguanylate cyclase [Bacillus alkalicola]
MSKSIKIGSTILWIFFFTIFMFIFVQATTSMIVEQWLALLSFLCLILIASLFPIRLRYTNIVPLQGISLAVFLQFGLLIEMLMMQMAIMTSLLSLRLSKQELYRIPLNSLIFMSVSIIAASSFYLAGGTTGDLSELSIQAIVVPVIVYAVVYFFCNNWFVHLIKKYLAGQKHIKFFSDALAWEAVSAVLIIPVGITLVLLYQEIGVVAIFLIGVPLFSLSLILRLYNQSETTKMLLKKVSDFGYQVNENIPEDKILDLFVETVRNIFPMNNIFIYENKSGKLGIIKGFSDSGVIEETQRPDEISRSVFEKGKSLYFSKRKQWVSKIHGDSGLSGVTRSIISVPVMHSHQVIGVITMTASRTSAFEKSHMMLLEIMSNYLAVAIENARNYELKKQESEQCALTNLYNFRYFESLLIEKYEDPKADEQFAIILLDLDHFKKINDTYGHHSGNEVLKQVAQVIFNTIGESGVVARYGGEEFVVLLEGEEASFAEEMAEALRVSIESQIFTVTDDLRNGERRSVRVTASIGVADKTEPTETAMSVLRNADRAMYTGAKQKGRNRVSHF